MVGFSVIHVVGGGTEHSVVLLKPCYSAWKMSQDKSSG